MTKKYILSLSCHDIIGIVASVSGFLRDNGGFIIESAQFGDPFSKRFFMRSYFEADKSVAELKELFQPIAAQFKMDWEIFDTGVKPKVMILVSKQGHCLNDILHRQSTGNLQIEIPIIASNHQTQQKIANWYEIPYHHLPVTKETQQEQEKQIMELATKHQIDLIVLARYMQILSPSMCDKLQGRAINIHHSFLPGFKGANPYRQAYERGVKIIGATAHYVTKELDEGPIIEQEVIRVDHTHAPDELKSLGRDIESTVLARAIKRHIEHRVILNGSKTVVFK